MFRNIRNWTRPIQAFCHKHLAARAKKPKFLLQQLKAEGYYSQCGQDKWIIERLFPDKKNGTFVDVGAYDGITFSNTYFLEQKGWTGLAVEPTPSVYERLVKNRQCITINGCVAQQSGKKRFRVITGDAQMLNGLVDEYDARHIKRIKKELDSYGGEYKDIEINCYNFNELLESHGIDKVDYLNIDAEGAEYQILKSIDYDRIQILVIGVENNYHDYRIPKLLLRMGFKFHSVVGDEFYLNRIMV
ncbi:MAG: FkbM family methyltransferase [Candidatus Marinimicrobia bacterium]|nr:FkbM family methyltransferase [Candidatus Neomarinimicrobiota bacterium]